MLHYFVFAGLKPFFINIREKANIYFAPFFDRLCSYFRQREYGSENVFINVCINVAM